MFGAKKYAPNSWKSHNKDFMAACMRHIDQHKNHEYFDKESGLLHLDHAITNLMFLRWQLIKEIGELYTHD